MIYLIFIVSASLIVWGGIILTKQADALSEELNLGKALVGVLLLGFITSLPEAITSVYSALVLHANDLAVGNLFGSNNFNPIILVIMDIFYRRGSITNAIEYHRSHSASVVFAVMMTCVAGFDLVQSGIGMNIGGVSVTSLVICMLYVLGLYQISLYQNQESSAVPVHRYHVWSIVYKLIFSAALVVAGGIFLSQSADKIALTTGLGRTFVGTLLVALTTSLPEIVVSLSALKLGQLDLAVGNIFGSNMTNMAILAGTDLLNGQEQLLSNISPSHLLTAGASLLITAIAVAGLKNHTKPEFCRIGIDSWVMLFVFIGSMFVLYLTI